MFSRRPRRRPSGRGRGGPSPAQLVQPRPCRLIAGQAEHALQRKRADALPLVDDVPGGGEPAGQRRARAGEDRPRSHRRVAATRLTAPKTVGLLPPPAVDDAAEPADEPVGPAQPFEVPRIAGASGPLVGESWSVDANFASLKPTLEEELGRETRIWLSGKWCSPPSCGHCKRTSARWSRPATRRRVRPCSRLSSRRSGSSAVRRSIRPSLCTRFDHRQAQRARQDSNLRPLAPEASALSTELRARVYVQG